MAASEFHPTALKWAKDFLRYLKVPVTRANITNVISWSAKENTTARYNLLGTVDHLPGSTRFNPGDVQNYASYRDGIKANAQHIIRYTPEIRTALRKGNLSVASFASVVAQSGWGSGTFPEAQPNYVSPALAGGGTQTLSVNSQGNGLVFPLPQGSYQMGGGPGKGTHNQSDWQSGNAQDYLAPGGTPVSSPVAGTVVKVSGHDPAQGVIKSGSKIIFGQSVTIRAANGQEWFLTHLGNVALKPGQTLAAGQQIGVVGDIKGGTPHLHIAVNTGNPTQLLSGASLDGGSAPSGAVPTGAPPTQASYGIAPYDPSQAAPPQIPTETGIAPPGSEPIGAPAGRSPQETWQLISQQQFVSPDTQNLLQGA